LYPLLLETLTGDKISVGPPFFNMTFGLLMAPLLVIVPFGPLLAWKRGDLLAVLQRLYLVAILAFVVAVVFFYVQHGGPVLAVLG
ncbi:cytochrome c-type biogenesis CcmF C-terminal domain-containing protein, partial [Rhizobium sp. RHZ01]